MKGKVSKEIARVQLENQEAALFQIKCSATECSFTGSNLIMPSHEKDCLLRKCQGIIDRRKEFGECFGCGFPDTSERLADHESSCEVRCFKLLAALLSGRYPRKRHAVLVDAVLAYANHMAVGEVDEERAFMTPLLVRAMMRYD